MSRNRLISCTPVGERPPWAYGSYSNWPPGLTLQGHQNLRANNDRLWYAGEATSQEYYGYLHGAYYEGKRAGEQVAACLQGKGDEGQCSSSVGLQEKRT